MIIGDIIVFVLKLIDKKKNVPILHKLYGAFIIGIAVIAASTGFPYMGQYMPDR